MSPVCSSVAEGGGAAVHWFFFLCLSIGFWCCYVQLPLCVVQLLCSNLSQKHVGPSTRNTNDEKDKEKNQAGGAGSAGDAI